MGDTLKTRRGGLGYYSKHVDTRGRRAQRVGIEGAVSLH
jgi:hypothetical protein